MIVSALIFILMTQSGYNCELVTAAKLPDHTKSLYEPMMTYRQLDAQEGYVRDIVSKSQISP